MAYTLTAVIASICFINACVIGHWAWNTNIIPLKDKKASYAVVQAIAFIIAFALAVLCWYLFTHQALPQWLTGVGSRPSSGGEISQQNTVYNADGFITLLAFPFLVAALAMGVIYATKYALTNIDYKHTGRKIGDISERKKTDIFDDSVFAGAGATVLTLLLCVLAMTSDPKGTSNTFGGKFGLDYKQVITTNKTHDEKVLYENDKNIAIEVADWKQSKWVNIADIATIKQLPSTYTNQYRVSKGYDTLKIGDVWFTELHNVTGDIPKGLEDKAVIKVTKVTLVSENVSFRDGTNTDIVRSTDDIKRVHIEYEVTNIDELRAGVQNKEELKQFIGGE